MASDSEIIKIALKIDDSSYLHKINKADSLQKIIDDICREYKKNNVINKYGLQFTHMPDENIGLKNKYVTEDNKSEIKDGYIISLVGSINYMLEWIFVSNDNSFEDVHKKLLLLPNLCDDPGVLKEMVKQGIQNKIPVKILKQKNENLLLCIKSLKNILNNGIQPKTINSVFIDFLINTIKDEKNSEILTSTLELLNLIMNNEYFFNNLIINSLSINDVMPYIWHSDKSDLQLQTLALLNNIIRILGKDKNEFIEKLKLTKHKNYIYKYLTENAAKCPKLSHELCIYQSHILSSYAHLFNETVHYSNDFEIPLEIDRREIIDFEEKDIRSRLNTFSSDSSGDLLSNYSRSNSINDQIDGVSLRSKSISMLSLLSVNDEPVVLSKLTTMCIEYYKRTYEKNFTMSVLETQYSPGFFNVCDQITKILADILYISRVPDEESQLYIPLIFSPSNNEFFEELFCRAIWLIAKTRREMRAKVDEDHEKVLAVLKEQILIGFNTRSMLFKELTEKLKKISYQEVFNKWEKERNTKWNNMIKNSPVLQEVKKQLEPNMHELIREQRLETMRRGEVFIKILEKRGKQQYWYISLMKCNKKLQYGDYDPDTLKFTSQKTQISIKSIQHVVTGKASRLIKEHKIRKQELAPRCFSLLFNNESEGLDFFAQNDLTAQHWIDGFHLLIGKHAESNSYKQDLDILLTMELNLHLIDLQNITIPENPPEIPPLPPDFRKKPNLPPKSEVLRQSIITRRMNSNHN